MDAQPVDPDNWLEWSNDVIDDDYDKEAPGPYEMGPLAKFVLTLRKLEFEPWTDSEDPIEWDVYPSGTGDGLGTWHLQAPPGREAEWALVCGMFATQAPDPTDAVTAIRAALSKT